MPFSMTGWLPMLVEKRCVAKDCKGIACYGFGLPSKGAARWACAKHKDLIWPALASPGGVAGEGAAARGSAAAAPALHKQKGLFG
jgi:hypothetical protein